MFRLLRHRSRTPWEVELAERMIGRRPSLVELEELEKKLMNQSHYHGIVFPSRLAKRRL